MDTRSLFRSHTGAPRASTRPHPLLALGVLLVLSGACSSDPEHDADAPSDDSALPNTNPGPDAAAGAATGTSPGAQPMRDGGALDATTGADALVVGSTDAQVDAAALVDASAAAPALTFTCPSGSATLVNGMNSLSVGGKTRDFYVDLPSDPTQKMGVLFSWHGFNDSFTRHRTQIGLDPNANAALPVIVITPDDTGIQPPMGLDWDIVRGSISDNPDLQFFEAILGCLHAQLPLDTARLYSFGFSAGSVMTALLHSTYPKLLSATINESGGWFNDAAEAKLVNWLTVKWTWPALDPADHNAVLLTHGGSSDVTVLSVLDLEKSAQAAFPFLKVNNRVVVDCSHNLGHAMHPDVTGLVVSKFISAHHAGTDSPYLGGGYAAADFPASCQLRLP